MKLNELLGSIESLRVLSRLPIKASVSFRLAKLMREVDAVLNDFTQAQQALRSKYNDTTESGYTQELAALLEEEVSITIPTVTLDDLGDAQIEPIHVMTLSWIIQEE